jgi:hypothetical protein
MKPILYRCPDSKHQALASLAKAEGLSVQKLFDHWVTQAVAERQSEARFHQLAAKGNPARGRKLLAEIQRRLSRVKN